MAAAPVPDLKAVTFMFSLPRAAAPLLAATLIAGTALATTLPARAAETAAKEKPAAEKVAKDKAAEAPAKDKTAAEKPASEKPVAAPAPKGENPAAAATQAQAGEGEEQLAVTDVDESFDLPPYPMGARIATGKMNTYTVQEEDTFPDIARYFGLGYVELRAANPTVDPWAPTPGTELVIPSFKLLPRAPQDGLVVNLGEMRMYYFKTPGAEPLTYALGIGREGLNTPMGSTKIVRKNPHPSWYPTARMRKEKPDLPAAVPPGPANPLGTRAMYLGWPEVLIHGSNKPWGIGRRVSSGCMRMYPEDIESLFDMVPIGTKVTVVDQPILVGWLDSGLYIEANPSKTQSMELEAFGEVSERPLTDAMKKVIIDAAGPDAADRIDWDVVDQAVRERRGYPVLIAQPSPAREVKMPSKEELAAQREADQKAKAEKLAAEKADADKKAADAKPAAKGKDKADSGDSEKKAEVTPASYN